MEQLPHLMISIAILVICLFFVLRMIIPRSTRSAIEHAVWHRIICGSSSNAISFAKVVKFLLVILGLLYLVSIL